MLTQICQCLRNWFELDKWPGAYKVTGGVLTCADGAPLALLYGQYYRIIGSVFNDGVHKWGDVEDALTDEPEFSGAVWPMRVPPDVVALAADIAAWCEANKAAINSPYQSESFGGYSYSLRTGNGADGGNGAATWQSQFAARLAPWRKI